MTHGTLWHRVSSKPCAVWKRARYRIVQRGLKLISYGLPWRTPEILSGEGALGRQLPRYAAERGIARALIVSDRRLAELGAVARAAEGLQAAGIDVRRYEETKPNPSLEQVEEVAGMYASERCGALVAVGGGSPMDCAKGAAARVSRPDRQLTAMAGFLKVRRRTVPLYAVPTTAGSGSETTVAAVLTDSSARRKFAINDVCLIPDCAVHDPSLLFGLPPSITAQTGMDALCHAVEAFIGKSNTRATRVQAKEAVRLIFANLLPSWRNGYDLEARTNMQLAAFRAGQAFTRAYVGYVHAIAHTLGGFYDVPHGLANAVVLPIVLEYYGSAVYRQLAELARAADLDSAIPADHPTSEPEPLRAVSSRSGSSIQEAARSFIEAIRGLSSAMELPQQLECIRDDDIPAMTRYALEEAHPVYPVPRILEAADLRTIYRRVRGSDICCL